MNNKARKLSLHRETIRNLSADALRRAAGGVFTLTDDPGTIHATNCGTCDTICVCPPTRHCGTGGTYRECCVG